VYENVSTKNTSIFILTTPIHPYTTPDDGRRDPRSLGLSLVKDCIQALRRVSQTSAGHSSALQELQIQLERALTQAEVLKQQLVDVGSQLLVDAEPSDAVPYAPHSAVRTSRLEKERAQVLARLEGKLRSVTELEAAIRAKQREMPEWERVVGGARGDSEVSLDALNARLRNSAGEMVERFAVYEEEQEGIASSHTASSSSSSSAAAAAAATGATSVFSALQEWIVGREMHAAATVDTSETTAFQQLLEYAHRLSSQSSSSSSFTSSSSSPPAVAGISACDMVSKVLSSLHSSLDASNACVDALKLENAAFAGTLTEQTDTIDAQKCQIELLEQTMDASRALEGEHTAKIAALEVCVYMCAERVVGVHVR
jgi:hypothetical protein